MIENGALADFEVSATEVAVIVTAEFVGTADGAVKVVGEPLVVLPGATVPHPGEQVLPA